MYLVFETPSQCASEPESPALFENLLGCPTSSPRVPRARGPRRASANPVTVGAFYQTKQSSVNSRGVDEMGPTV